MTKNYTYKNISYIIKVELNVKAERHINGRQWDKVIIHCHNILSREKYVERDSLLSTISIFSLECNSKIDDLENKKTGFEKILSDMGFE